MDIDGARALYTSGASAAGQALNKSGPWWPKDQTEASAVSFGMALAWTQRIPTVEQPRYLCLNAPRTRDPGRGHDENAPKLKLIRAAVAATQHRAKGRLEFLPGEAMLDFAVLPAHSALEAGLGKFALLTMESEMCASHGVEPQASRHANDYAWDLAKLLWAPSPRRLFVARVGGTKPGTPVSTGRTRRLKLCETIDTLLRYYGGLSHPEDVLVTVVLPADGREVSDATLRVWQGGIARGDWAPLFNTPRMGQPESADG